MNLSYLTPKWSDQQRENRYRIQQQSASEAPAHGGAGWFSQKKALVRTVQTTPWQPATVRSLQISLYWPQSFPVFLFITFLFGSYILVLQVLLVHKLEWPHLWAYHAAWKGPFWSTRSFFHFWSSVQMSSCSWNNHGPCPLHRCLLTLCFHSTWLINYIFGTQHLVSPVMLTMSI